MGSTRWKEEICEIRNYLHILRLVAVGEVLDHPVMPGISEKIEPFGRNIVFVFVKEHVAIIFEVGAKHHVFKMRFRSIVCRGPGFRYICGNFFFRNEERR